MFVNKERKAQEDLQEKQMNHDREQVIIQTSTQTDPYTEPPNPAIDQGKSDLIRWQQELDPEITELVYRLKGFVQNKNGDWLERAGAVPLCNDLFIYDVVLPKCKALTSRNHINSNYTEARILTDLKLTSNTVANNMADGYFNYKIDYKNMTLVLSLIKDVIKPSAFRALNGWTKKTDSTIHKRIETSIDNENNRPQKNFLGMT